MKHAARIIFATMLTLGSAAVFAQSQGMQHGMGGGMMRGPAGQKRNLLSFVVGVPPLCVLVLGCP